VPQTWLDTSPNWWIDTLGAAIGWGPGRGTGILGLVWEGVTPGTLTLVIIHGWAFNDPNDPTATGTLTVQSESNSILLSNLPASDIAIVFTPSTAVALVEIHTVGNLSFFEFSSATLQQ
jgi:hypothetical protein